MDEYNSVIKKYDRLCEERNNHLFWAENITEASSGITSKIVWQNFYVWFVQPKEGPGDGVVLLTRRQRTEAMEE